MNRPNIADLIYKVKNLKGTQLKNKFKEIKGK